MEGGKQSQANNTRGGFPDIIYKGRKRKKKTTFRKSYELYYCTFCTVLRDDFWDVKKNVTFVQ